MRHLTVVLLTALLLAGCTSSTDDSDAPDQAVSDGGTTSAPTTTAAPQGPDCADVWKAGATLPADYESCVTDGAYGSQDVTKCQDGTRLVAYLDTYYAVTGGTIAHPDVAPMQDTPEFSKAYAACTGE